MKQMTMTRARASALLFGGAALGIGTRTSAQTTQTVRVAAIPIAGAAEPAIAKELGYFTQAGLDVDIRLMQGSSAIATAVLSNAVDIGFAAVDTLATIYRKGVPLVAIAPTSEYISAMDSHDAALVVPLNSQVRRAADLNGKVIGVNSLAGIAFLSTRAWIDQHGGDSSAIKFVEVPFTAMPVALQTDRVDAVQVTEPFIAPAAKNGRILTYGLNDAVAKHFVISVWFTTPAWAAAHADVVRRFAGAIRSAAVWTNRHTNPAKLEEILANFTKIDPAVLAMMLVPHYGEELTPALLQPPIDLDAKYNNSTPVAAQELIYAPPR